jgi:hypothetical protein
MDGKAYLEQVIAERLAHRRADLAGIRGIAQGLVAAGVLSQEDSARLLAALRDKLVELGLLVTKQASASASGSVSASSWAKRREPAEDPPIPELRAVRSLVGHTATIGAKTVTFVSLELWSTQFLVRFAHRPEHPSRALHWSAWDDLANDYHSGNGGSFGISGWLSEHRIFTPALPAEARTLTLTLRSGSGTDETTVALPL